MEILNFLRNINFYIFAGISDYKHLSVVYSLLNKKWLTVFLIY